MKCLIMSFLCWVAGIFVTRFKRKHYIPVPAQKILKLIKENPRITRNGLAKAHYQME